ALRSLCLWARSCRPSALCFAATPRPPPAPPLFPYTTLFRSSFRFTGDVARRLAVAAAIVAVLLGGLSVRSVLALRGDRADLAARSEEHTSELQSLAYLVCRLLLEKKTEAYTRHIIHQPHEPR